MALGIPIPSVLSKLRYHLQSKGSSLHSNMTVRLLLLSYFHDPGAPAAGGDAGNDAGAARGG